MNGFEIISKLGDGAYSVVYKVKRYSDNKIYALKKVKLINLSEKEKKNSLNEVRILASVKSNFVISYKEAFIDENDKSLCIVMEYADKGDLYQKITHFKKKSIYFEEIDIWRIFIQMVKGLKALHDLKILHRDLKSANIFLFSDGSVKLGDLNVSIVAKKGVGYTQTGTPYYASPEVWNEKPYDSKSDIWSLGCVTYEMLTLMPPFRAENMEGLYNKVIKGQFSKLPNKYSKDLTEILNLMLKVNPSERPSCVELLRHPLLIKRVEFFKEEAGVDNINLQDGDEAVLLRTIKVSNNILGLSEKLPQPNYDKENLFKKKSSHQKGSVTMSPKENLPDLKPGPIKTENGNKSSNFTERSSIKIDKVNYTSESLTPESNIISNIINGNNSNSMSNNNINSNSNRELETHQRELPSLNLVSKNQSRQKKIKKNNQSNDVSNYLRGISELNRIYAPYLDLNFNLKKGINGNKGSYNKKNIHLELYQPKRNRNPNNYGIKVVPNIKLAPLHLKRSPK